MACERTKYLLLALLALVLATSGIPIGWGHSDTSGNFTMQYSGGASLNFGGATGDYAQWGGTGFDSSTHVDLIWEDDEFVASSGTGLDSNSGITGESFSGSGTSTDSETGAESSIVYSFYRQTTDESNAEWDYVTDSWVQSSGAGEGTGEDEESLRVEVTSTYTVEPYGVEGMSFNARWESHNVGWTTVSSYGSGGWVTTGSGGGGGGGGGGSEGNQSDRTASGEIAQGCLTGTYDEGDHSYDNFEYELMLSLGTTGGWLFGGSGSGVGNGGSHKTIEVTNSDWSASAHGVSVSGTSTETYDESFGYGFDYQAKLDLGVTDWRLLSGSGSGAGGANSTRDGSGSGTNSASFNDGLGTIDGTVEVNRHDSWDYNHWYPQRT